MRSGFQWGNPRSVAELDRRGLASEAKVERHPLDLPEPAALPSPVYSGPQDLTPSQQLALLMLNNRNQLAKECVAKLYASTVKAGWADFQALVERRWAAPDGKGRHKILPGGRFNADALARIVAKQLDIHFFMQGGSRFQATLRCTCGWTYSHSRNEGHERSAFARRMGEHLESVGQKAATVVAGNPVPSQQPATTTELPSVFMLEPRGEPT
jgi:hypothetical protein